MALSERQQRILEFIRRFTLENEYPPTIREIGAAVGISSTSVVNYNLNILQREGHIIRNKEVSRGIRLSEGLKELASRDILKVLGQEQNIPIDPLAVAKEKELEYLKLLEHVNPIHEVVDIARHYHNTVPLAVASGGIKTIIERVLIHLGIRDLFQAVVTSEDVTHQKPAPDIFLEAAKRIGVPPEHCRAYEDTDIGLQAIRSARMEAVDVRTLRPV